MVMLMYALYNGLCILQIVEGYGQTECTAACTMTLPKETKPGRFRGEFFHTVITYETKPGRLGWGGGGGGGVPPRYMYSKGTCLVPWKKTGGGLGGGGGEREELPTCTCTTNVHVLYLVKQSGRYIALPSETKPGRYRGSASILLYLMKQSQVGIGGVPPYCST